jgi:hypothetical protein
MCEIWRLESNVWLCSAFFIMVISKFQTLNYRNNYVKNITKQFIQLVMCEMMCSKIFEITKQCVTL